MSEAFPSCTDLHISLNPPGQLNFKAQSDVTIGPMGAAPQGFWMRPILS